MTNSTEELTAIVLAAGQGTRMRSALPKPLHELCGRTMLAHALAALVDLAPARVIVVVGRGADEVVASVEATPTPFPVVFAEQREQLGTGHAVRVALDADTGADRSGQVVVLPGDAPLLRPATLEGLVAHHRESDTAGTLLTARIDDPTGYGRVVRGVDGRVTGVVEQADATVAQAAIDEVNTSMYCFDRAALDDALDRIGTDNAQGEWYLTDVVGVLADSGAGATAWVMDDPAEAAGVNDRVQLAAAGAVMRQRIATAWMRAGVTIVDPATTHIDVDVTLADDVTIHPGAVLRGRTRVGPRSVIGPHATLRDAEVGAGAHIGASAVLDPGATVPADGTVASLAHVVGNPSGDAG